MDPFILWLVQFLFTGSILVLAAAIFIHVSRVRRHLEGLNPEEMKRRIAFLEKKASEIDGEIAVHTREGAELKIKVAALEGDVKEVREESARFLGVFKTVLYGFDYIVQGCKNALEITGAEEQPAEKQIVSDERRATSDK